jgi:hypothetical protein
MWMILKFDVTHDQVSITTHLNTEFIMQWISISFTLLTSITKYPLYTLQYNARCSLSAQSIAGASIAADRL